MAEKNTKKDQKSKKKHKWVGIFLIALLLLFIGLAGYYLERDLEPVPDNQIEDSQVLEERENDLEDETAMNGEEREIAEPEDSAEVKETETQETEDSAEVKEVETSETEDRAEVKKTETSETEKNEIKENGDKSEVKEIEIEETEETSEVEKENVSSDIEDTNTESDLPASEQVNEVEQDEKKVKTDLDEDAVEDRESEITADSESEETEVNKDSDLETDQTADKEKESASADIETEGEKSASEQRIKDGADVEQEVKSDETTAKDEDSSLNADLDNEEETEKVENNDFKQKSDINQKSEDSLEDDSSQLDTEVDSDGSDEVERKNDFSQELEDPSLLDRILSILGLSDSSFSQDLNILVVGLDDEESVALGTIEADSIMLAKLRPEKNKMQFKHIDEDTKYKGQLLREYHNGDIQLAVEEISETEIDYYVYVNYLGFEKVIDELGGVKITLAQEVKVPGLGLNLKAGDNLLSGKEALNFVRWRGSDSIARFERQKLLINSVMAKLKSNNILFNVKELYNTIVESYNSIETDINPVLAAEIFNYFRENDELELEFIE